MLARSSFFPATNHIAHINPAIYLMIKTFAYSSTSLLCIRIIHIILRIKNMFLIFLHFLLL